MTALAQRHLAAVFGAESWRSIDGPADLLAPGLTPAPG
jgi:hypothetical protein